MKAAMDAMLDRIGTRNLERIRASCEADGDRELAQIIAARLQAARAHALSSDGRLLRS
jgi:hypothetical protein